MARHESDREDLIRDAVALKFRVELAVPGEPELILAGFREDGRLSIYFGPDPVYHFDRQGRLRRAFVDGLLFRSEGKLLARLNRKREPDETILVRDDLEGDLLDEFMRSMHQRVGLVLAALRSQSASIVRQVPPEYAFVERLPGALETIVSLKSRLALRE